MNEFTVETEREEDDRWIGEVAEIPGVLVYGATRGDLKGVLHGDVPRGCVSLGGAEAR